MRGNEDWWWGVHGKMNATKIRRLFTAQNTFAVDLLAARRAWRRLRRPPVHAPLPFTSYGSDGVSWTRRFFPGVANVLFGHRDQKTLALWADRSMCKTKRSPAALCRTG